LKKKRINALAKIQFAAIAANVWLTALAAARIRNRFGR